MGLDFWNWDWGGAGHAIQNNPVSETLNNGWRGVTDSEIGRQVVSGAAGIGAGLATMNPGVGLATYGATNAVLQENSRQHGSQPGTGVSAQSIEPAPNPYADPNNAGLLAKIQAGKDQVGHSFDVAERNARVAAAASGRGGMGLGRADQANLEGDRAGALARTETGLRQQNAQLAAAFDQNQASRILGGQQFDATMGQRRFLLDNQISADDEAAWGDSARMLARLLPFLTKKDQPTSTRYSGYDGGMA